MVRFQIRRRTTGAVGAPAALLSGELAYNQMDRKVYIGYGDDGAGNATSIRTVAGDDFNYNVPVGAEGKFLKFVGGVPVWTDVPAGAVYAASENGIELVGSTFQLHYTEIATGIGLSNYVTSSSLSTTLAGYQNKDADLTAIAALAGTVGFLRKTAADTWTLDTTSYSAVGHTHAAGDITSGVFAVGLIPSLDAAKITTGVFDVNRIPSLDAGKTTTGVFDAARIPSLDASKIATGTIDIARLPILPGTVQIVSAGGIANLTAPQQAEIGDGSVVTTTDGRRWIYSGTGSKTIETSYIEMSDVTPEWSIISNKPVFATVATSGSYTDLTNRPALHAVATSGSYTDLINKPAFATVATSGSYADLSNRPALGTMSSQNANAVAITGGTISGIVLDGGTF